MSTWMTSDVPPEAPGIYKTAAAPGERAFFRAFHNGRWCRCERTRKAAEKRVLANDRPDVWLKETLQ